MKIVTVFLLGCISFQTYSQVGEWPYNSGLNYFGATGLDHSIQGNYALLQSKSDGTTYLNSPLNIYFRIGNGDKMLLTSSGYFGVGTITPSARLHVNGQVKIDGTNALEFGSGLTKETSAGKIAYQKFSDGLDIIGAGTSGSNRKIKFYNEGGASFNGKIEVVSDDSFLRFRGTTIAASTPLDIVNLGFQGITGAMNVSFRIGYPYPGGVNNGTRLDFLKVINGNTVLTTGENGSTLGKVGIGTTNPQSQLEIRGSELRLSDMDIRYLSISRDANGTPYGRAYSNSVAGGRQFRISEWSHEASNSGSVCKDILHFDGFNLMLLENNGGNIGIGTTAPSQRLTVKGTVYSTEVKVDISAGSGPDYVFGKDYALPSLESVKTYIDQNKHLPEVPSAKEMEANGINLSEMNLLLLKKVEELTLYVIDLKNKHEIQQQLIDNQQKEIEMLKRK